MPSPRGNSTAQSPDTDVASTFLGTFSNFTCTSPLVLEHKASLPPPKNSTSPLMERS